MKKNLTLIVLAMLLANGCDAIRTLAGRPTSEEVASRRFEKAEKEAREEEQKKLQEAKIAASQAAEKHTADSLTAYATLDSLGIVLKPSSDMARFMAEPMNAPFYYMLGSFGLKSNADRLAAEVAAAGYAAVLIPYTSGNIAVAVPVEGDILDVLTLSGRLKSEKFTPKDAWVLYKVVQ